jgi:hypothetical protein
MADEWTTEGSRITDVDVLATLRRIIDDESVLIVEHRYYRGARAPLRLVFDDADRFEDYVRTETRPGDSFHLWRYEDCCRDENIFVSGKVPDSEGRTPKGGSY